MVTFVAAVGGSIVSVVELLPPHAKTVKLKATMVLMINLLFKTHSGYKIFRIRSIIALIEGVVIII